MRNYNKKEKSSCKTFSVFDYSKEENKSQIVQERKLNPICYQIHDYLKKNAVGYENRKTAQELMDIFNIRSSDVLRQYIREIRDSEIIHKPICSKSGSGGKNGYWIATELDEIIKSADALESRGWDCIKRARKMKKKAKLHNQKRIVFSKYEKDVIESVIDNE